MFVLLGGVAVVLFGLYLEAEAIKNDLTRGSK